MQALDYLVLEVVPTTGERRLLHRLPRQRRRTTVLRHDVRAQRRVVVLLEVGPVERHDDLFACSEHELRPRRRQASHVDGRIAEEAVHLLHAKSRLRPGDLGVAFTDGVHTERRCAKHARDAVRQRQDAARVQIIREQLLDKLPTVQSMLFRRANRGRHVLRVNTARREWTDVTLPGLRNEGIPQVVLASPFFTSAMIPLQCRDRACDVFGSDALGDAPACRPDGALGLARVGGTDDGRVLGRRA